MLIPWLVLLAIGAPAFAKRSQRITVVARVVEAPQGPTTCGVITNIEVVRFEVIEIKNGFYTARDLFVAVMCPEGLENGQVYRLVLEPVGKKMPFVDGFPTGLTRYRIVASKRLRN